MKNKFLKLMLSLLAVFGLCACNQVSEEEKVEEAFLRNGYWIDATESGVAIKTRYEETQDWRYWCYSKNSESSISFEDSYLLDDISINPENGEIDSSISKYTPTQNELEKLKENANNELKKLNIDYETLRNYMNYKMEKDPNSVGESEDAITKEKPQKIISETKKHYIIATTITRTDLDKDFLGMYSYNDITFTSDDCIFIDSWYNTKGLVNQGAFYRKMATILEGFKLGFNNGSEYSEHILGFKTYSTDEFEPYVEDLSSFIVTDDNPLNIVMKKFSTLKSITGSFENKSFDFQINDLTQCAKELKISEEMLGYILAMLDEYAPQTNFEGNTYSFKLDIK